MWYDPAAVVGAWRDLLAAAPALGGEVAGAVVVKVARLAERELDHHRERAEGGDERRGERARDDARVRRGAFHATTTTVSRRRASNCFPDTKMWPLQMHSTNASRTRRYVS